MTEQWDQDRMRKEFPQLSAATKQVAAVKHKVLADSENSLSPDEYRALNRNSGPEMTIRLPLPHRSLSPNSRGHWATKAKWAKLFRGMAKLAVWNQTWSVVGPQWESVSVQCTFTFADRRKRDRDNLLSSMKAAFDGIADAGVVFNDSGMTHEPVVITEPDKASCGVVVRITKIS